jgi:hypothetical protein
MPLDAQGEHQASLSNHTHGGHFLNLSFFGGCVQRDSLSFSLILALD